MPGTEDSKSGRQATACKKQSEERESSSRQERKRKIARAMRDRDIWSIYEAMDKLSRKHTQSELLIPARETQYAVVSMKEFRRVHKISGVP